MSSGIRWMYEIQAGQDLSVPPISYRLGLGWASGAYDEAEISLARGLETPRTAYAALPGLAGHTALWLNSPLDGARTVAQRASAMLASAYARKKGSYDPILNSSRWERTTEEWTRNFCCGVQIAEHAGVSLDTPFIEAWQALCLAAVEWPKEMWGLHPKRIPVDALVVTADRGQRPVTGAEREHVLQFATQLSMAVDTRGLRERARVELAKKFPKKD